MPIPLIEKSVKDITRTLKRHVELIKGVEDCHQLNVRITGKRCDVELVIEIDNKLDAENFRKVSLDVEQQIKRDLPNARVIVHSEPKIHDKESAWMLVKGIAEEAPGSRGVHNIHIQRIEGKLCVDLHLEVDSSMTVKDAHESANFIENRLKTTGQFGDITIHIETSSQAINREMMGVEIELQDYIQFIATQFPEIKGVNNIKIRKIGKDLHVVLGCKFMSDFNIGQAHIIASKLESKIKSKFPRIARIDIHEEPDTADETGK